MSRHVSPEEWRELLRSVLSDSRRRAESQIGQAIDADLPVEIAGYGLSGRTYTSDEAADAIYLGPGQFYRIIDVAVRFYPDGRLTYWLYLSGHPPGAWENTWEPSERGPLKVIGLMAPRKMWIDMAGRDSVPRTNIFRDHAAGGD